MIEQQVLELDALRNATRDWCSLHVGLSQF